MSLIGNNNLHAKYRFYCFHNTLMTQAYCNFAPAGVDRAPREARRQEFNRGSAYAEATARQVRLGPSRAAPFAWLRRPRGYGATDDTDGTDIINRRKLRKTKIAGLIGKKLSSLRYLLFKVFWGAVKPHEEKIS
jgi:hypothetical protein